MLNIQRSEVQPRTVWGDGFNKYQTKQALWAKAKEATTQKTEPMSTWTHHKQLFYRWHKKKNIIPTVKPGGGSMKLWEECCYHPAIPAGAPSDTGQRCGRSSPCRKPFGAPRRRRRRRRKWESSAPTRLFPSGEPGLTGR